MKYLKIFEEYSDDIITEIQNFSNDYLAYLIDKGVKVIAKREISQKIQTEITYPGQVKVIDSCHIFIGNLNTSIGSYINFDHKANTIGLKWSDIKDDIIPFITILKNKYNVREIIRIRQLNNYPSFNNSKELTYNTPLEDIIEDKLEDIDNIYYIRITIDIK